MSVEKTFLVVGVAGSVVFLVAILHVWRVTSAVVVSVVDVDLVVAIFAGGHNVMQRKYKQYQAKCSKNCGFFRVPFRGLPNPNFLT